MIAMSQRNVRAAYVRDAEEDAGVAKDKLPAGVLQS